MRSQVSRGPVGRVIVKSMMTVAVAALLAGCSNSIERFNEAYKNPSDADPVYTAAIPKIKKPMKPRLVQPSYDVASVDDDTIIESPLKRAAVPQIKKPLDYSQAYTPAYKQPKYKKPKLIKPPVDEGYDAVSADESYVEPVLDKPVSKKKYNRPLVAAEAETVVPATPKFGKIAKDGTLKVAEGMTMFSIAKSNGVTVDELADANGMNRPYSLLIGQSLRIPGAAVAQAPAPKKTLKPAKLVEPEATEEAEIKIPKPLKGGTTHTVVSGETLYSLGRKYGVSPFVIADANKLTAEKQLSLGQKVRIPGARKAIEQPVADDQVAAVEDVPAKPKPIKKKAPLALSEEDTAAENTDGETAIGEVPKQVAVAKPKIKEQPAQVADAAPVLPGMNLRWPLKGKVISGFGAKPDGLKNEGINIAVPEGTSVRAADGGVVAYAGNELKGYGNLVLIRHPGGYVTAYAHAKELFVKRGDKVARGDVIAKAGQTGAVTSPQLHFEVRKGATALDPMKFISSSTASN